MLKLDQTVSEFHKFFQATERPRVARRLLTELIFTDYQTNAAKINAENLENIASFLQELDLNSI